MISTESRLENAPDYFEDRFKNVVFARVDFAKLVAKTPLAEIWSKGIITTTGYYLNNISDALRTEFLALKHESRILGHSSNPVRGFSMTEQVRLCAVWPTENWLGSPLNHIQG